MADKNNIEEIFRTALEHHEFAVRPEVWAGVQTSLASSAAVGSASVVAGSSILGKAAAVIGMAALITGATVNEVNYQASMHQDDVSAQIDVQQHRATADAETEPQTEAAYNLANEIEDESAKKTHATSKNQSTNGEETIGDQAKSTVATESSDASQPVLSSEQPYHQSTSTASRETSSSTQRDQSVADGVSQNSQSSDTENESTTGAKEPAKDNSPSENDVNILSDSDEQNEPEPAKTTAYFTHDAEQMITPNGDPFNEYFEVEGFGIGSFHIRIMNQAGQVIYESDDINFRWNGVDRFGTKVPAGVYYYEILAVGTDSLPYLEKNARGNITVVR